NLAQHGSCKNHLHRGIVVGHHLSLISRCTWCRFFFFFFPEANTDCPQWQGYRPCCTAGFQSPTFRSSRRPCQQLENQRVLLSLGRHLMQPPPATGHYAIVAGRSPQRRAHPLTRSILMAAAPFKKMNTSADAAAAICIALIMIMSCALSSSGLEEGTHMHAHAVCNIMICYKLLPSKYDTHSFFFY
ncbi:unnamed protein product, partial [Urochloa humidicola]